METKFQVVISFNDPTKTKHMDIFTARNGQEAEDKARAAYGRNGIKKVYVEAYRN